VTLGAPEDQRADLAVVAGRREEQVSPFVVRVQAPRYRPPNGPDRALAEAYRRAIALADEREASSLALPGTLAIGPWPVADVTRIAMTVLLSTPSSVREVIIAAPTAAMVEVWAEALAREP
jgi:O-acetyl-ADP-ribose deacetylase (regulator of RNase III)